MKTLSGNRRAFYILGYGILAAANYAVGIATHDPFLIGMGTGLLIATIFRR